MAIDKTVFFKKKPLSIIKINNLIWFVSIDMCLKIVKKKKERSKNKLLVTFKIVFHYFG